MPQEPTKTTAKAGGPLEPAEDDVEKFLVEQKTLETHRHELIKELLKQKEAAIKSFDEKLARLGYEGEHAQKRTHHKRDAEKNAE
jgi:hypothetical protein